eukprot:54306-Pelagomonas_calceolata.AAC.2
MLYGMCARQSQAFSKGARACDTGWHRWQAHRKRAPETQRTRRILAQDEHQAMASLYSGLNGL